MIELSIDSIVILCFVVGISTLLASVVIAATERRGVK